MGEAVERDRSRGRHHEARSRQRCGVRLPDVDPGLVALWKASSGVAVTYWGSVLRRRWLRQDPKIEEVTGKELKATDNYTNHDDVTSELLDALTAAYREASAGGQ